MAMKSESRAGGPPEELGPNDFVTGTVQAVREVASECGPLADAVNEATDDLAVVNGVSKWANKRYARYARESESATNAAAGQAAKGVMPGQAGAGVFGSDLTEARTSAAGAVVNATGQALKLRVAAEVADTATKNVQTSAKSMQGLADKIDAETLRVTSPIGGSDSMSMEELWRENHDAAALLACPSPAKELSTLYGAAEKSGDVARMQRLESVGAVVLSELLRQPASVRAAAKANTTGNQRSAQEVSEETALARQLSQRFAEARRARVPAYVVQAAKCFEALRQAWIFVAGIDPLQCDPNTFARRFLAPGSIVLAQGAARWNAEKDYAVRFINPAVALRIPRLPTLGNG